ncbi:MAG: hypothetical protein HOV81_16545 [Kofleriaceae bacterium]|nr:hypothetical protein [Kofleriaceae bacterium]
MRHAAILIALLTIVSARTARADGECGDVPPSDEALEAIEHAADAEDAKTDEDEAPVLYRVPVYLHVVRRAPQGEGDMPVAHAREITIDLLNEEFAAQDIPFQFDLAKIDYINADDATYRLVQSSNEERALWDLAQVAGRRNLNIYIVGPRDDTRVTGWAEFLVNPALQRGDHVVLRYLPSKGAFSDPLVPVHEVGHWMGLLHTFHFGCGGLMHGDLIRDTPTQATGHSSCDAAYDSCPDDAGTDPIDNIMGYSHACRGTFSPGQIRRMKFLWRTVRGGKSDDVPVDDMAPTETTGCTATHGSSLGLVLLVLGLVLGRRRQVRASHVEPVAQTAAGA